jgi:hypothetical protein
MDIDALRAQKRAEIEQAGRQMAVDEILALKQRYQKASDLTYTFECEGQQVQGAFVTASLGQNPPNAYEIVLLAPATTVVAGQCHITDMHGKKLGASGSTQKGPKENRITLETLAVKPS